MLSRSQALAAAEKISPLLQKHANAVQDSRVLPAETISAIGETGLFGLMSPKKYGGSELDLSTLTAVTAKLAESCGSTAWVYQVLAGHNWLVSLFADEAQCEIFTSNNPLTASCTRAVGDVRRVDGGVLLGNVKGRFCSGIDHAGWIALVTSISDEGGSEAGVIIVPQASARIIDDWHTSGMRGTGSKSFEIGEAFVPDSRVVTMMALASGKSPGLEHPTAAIYRAPFPQILPLQLVGVPLGLAKAALNCFVEARKAKLAGASETDIAEQTPSLLLLSEASADIDAAWALVEADCALIGDGNRPERLGAINRARYTRNVAYAVQKCRAATNKLYEASGGSAIYDGFAMQRIWRDINAAAAHAAFMPERGGTMYGRAILDLPPSSFYRIGQ